MTTIKKFNIVWSFAALLLAGVAGVHAQPKKVVRILAGGSQTANAGRIAAFRDGLRTLGYVEGRNIVVEGLWANGKIERLHAYAEESARWKVDVILSAGPTVTRALKDAKVATPIVMGFDDDPISSGFAVSLARPGGNITGLSTLSPGVTGKQLELLNDIVPRLARVAVLGSLIHPGTAQSLKEMEATARAMKLQLQFLNIADPKEIDGAFGSARNARADALVVLTSVVTNTNRKSIADTAAKSRLPAVYYTAEWVEGGGLVSYGANYNDLFRRAAYYVDRILKGAKPGDLPIEQPTKFELMINLKTAGQLGLTIPPNVLARADRVIK
ncbi:MAG TPA: ABC transporter substrate-binding protein [Candidatus Binatia bacterium]|jgi:putative ABC transport system substrate-binding protein